MRVRQADLFATLPPEWPDDPLPTIRAQAAGQKVVVVDDDPTGTQTVHGIPVLADWSVPTLCAELASDLPAFYLLTNSRSLPLVEAQAINAAIGAHLAEAAERVGRRFVVASRSDSTLRGHFPGEVDALTEALGGGSDAVLLIPAFMAGGRFTVDDVHYVAEGEWLVPAGETEFARDAAFGFRASNLRDWVREKTQERIPASEVAAISLDDIRAGGPARVSQRLQSMCKGSICVVNAVSDRDLAVVALGVVQAEAQGSRFIYRTAASFVAARAGIVPRPLLTVSELNLPVSGGGLIVVGSYVPKTSAQVACLLESAQAAVEVDVEKLLSDTTQRLEIERAVDKVNRTLDRGEDVVVYTSRELISGKDSDSSLAIGRRVSQSLIAIVRALSVRPRYVLAKGGITSSDIATRGLDVRRAMVMGQILPGVPVWQLGPESRYPGLAYVVFPGNVGDERALAGVVRRLKQEG